MFGRKGVIQRFATSGAAPRHRTRIRLSSFSIALVEKPCGPRPLRSYLICATPRSGSTLLCEALIGTRRRRDPRGVLRSAAPQRPATAPAGVLHRRPGTDDSRHLASTPRSTGARPARTWDRQRLRAVPALGDRAGHDAQRVFGAKLMWGYFGDSSACCARSPNTASCRSRTAARRLPELASCEWCAPNKVRQAVFAVEGVQTATWRQENPGSRMELEDRRRRRPDATSDGHGPRLKFHFHAIEHLLDQILANEACWDAFFEHARISPTWSYTKISVENYEETAIGCPAPIGVEAPGSFSSSGA